jgi:glycosyltransferase involved in cell wall biosynthesis
MPRPSHVMLNALYFAPGVSGGPETYLRGLAPALAEERKDMRITVVTTRSGRAALQADGWENFAALEALPCEDGQRVRRQWAEQALLPRLARRQRVDIVHSLASVAPMRPGTCAVVTLHDVTFMLRPTFGRATTWGMSLLLRSAASHADGLIAVTAAARDEICSVLGVDASRFSVVHHGHELERSATPTAPESIRSRYDLTDSEVVLCVAAKRPHKNQELLIRAAPLLEAGTVVVLAGHAEPYEIELRALACDLGVEDRVRFVGYLSDADLEGMWQLAACTALPTLGEGFGLPALESLARGVPLAASNLPVLREVAGRLGHYFDPHDPADAARCIREAIADTQTRHEGPAYAASFSWSAAACGTCEAYDRALARHRGEKLS